MVKMLVILGIALWTGASLFGEEGTVCPVNDSVDHWGLSRHDQEMQFATRKRAYLKAHPGAPFAIGIEGPNEKVFRDKLWFKGKFANTVSLPAWQ